MRPSTLRRFGMALLALAIVIVLMGVGASTRDAMWARVILTSMALLFAGIIVRLVDAMHSSHSERRRQARRFIIMSAMVPVLVLVPAALEAAGRDYGPAILLVAAAWLLLAVTLTSALLAYATRPKQIRLVRSHFHRPTHVHGGRAVAIARRNNAPHTPDARG